MVLCDNTDPIFGNILGALQLTGSILGKPQTCFRSGTVRVLAWLRDRPSIISGESSQSPGADLAERISQTCSLDRAGGIARRWLFLQRIL